MINLRTNNHLIMSAKKIILKSATALLFEQSLIKKQFFANLLDIHRGTLLKKIKSPEEFTIKEVCLLAPVFKITETELFEVFKNELK